VHRALLKDKNRMQSPLSQKHDNNDNEPALFIASGELRRKTALLRAGNFRLFRCYYCCYANTFATEKQLIILMTLHLSKSALLCYTVAEHSSSLMHSGPLTFLLCRIGGTGMITGVRTAANVPRISVAR